MRKIKSPQMSSSQERKQVFDVSGVMDNVVGVSNATRSDADREFQTMDAVKSLTSRTVLVLQMTVKGIKLISH